VTSTETLFQIVVHFGLTTKIAVTQEGAQPNLSAVPADSGGAHSMAGWHGARVNVWLIQAGMALQPGQPAGTRDSRLVAGEAAGLLRSEPVAVRAGIRRKDRVQAGATPVPVLGLAYVEIG
jgi:hypothetical protein